MFWLRNYYVLETYRLRLYYVLTKDQKERCKLHVIKKHASKIRIKIILLFIIIEGDCWRVRKVGSGRVVHQRPAHQEGHKEHHPLPRHLPRDRLGSALQGQKRGQKYSAISFSGLVWNISIIDLSNESDCGEGWGTESVSYSHSLPFAASLHCIYLIVCCRSVCMKIVKKSWLFIYTVQFGRNKIFLWEMIHSVLLPSQLLLEILDWTAYY